MTDIEVEVEAEAWLTAVPRCEALAREAASAALADDGPEGSVTILLTDDAEVRQLNRDHRRKDAPTGAKE